MNLFEYMKRLFPEQIQIYYWRSFYKTHEHYNPLIKSKGKDNSFLMKIIYKR